jgi:hypothetical protein
MAGKILEPRRYAQILETIESKASSKIEEEIIKQNNQKISNDLLPIIKKIKSLEEVPSNSSTNRQILPDILTRESIQPRVNNSATFNFDNFFSDQNGRKTTNFTELSVEVFFPIFFFIPYFFLFSSSIFKEFKKFLDLIEPTLKEKNILLFDQALFGYPPPFELSNPKNIEQNFFVFLTYKGIRGFSIRAAYFSPKQKSYHLCDTSNGDSGETTIMKALINCGLLSSKESYWIKNETVRFATSKRQIGNINLI